MDARPNADDVFVATEQEVTVTRSPLPESAIALPSTPSLRATIQLLRSAQQVTVDLMTRGDLQATLQAVVDGTTSLGFACAAMNLVHDDGQVEVVAVSGPPSLTDLLGQTQTVQEWTAIGESCDTWGSGSLRFLPAERADSVELSAEWHISDDEAAALLGHLPAQRPQHDAWHHDDLLLAMMHDSDGALTGVLSVDEPLDGRRPGLLRRELLELYATQARVAIQIARTQQRAQRAVLALRRETERLEQTFDAAPTGMATVSLLPESRGRVTKVNEALISSLGQPAQILLAGILDDHVHPDDRGADDSPSHPGRATSGRSASGQANPRQSHPAAPDSGPGVRRTERRYLHADGQTVWMSESRIIMTDAHGRPELELVHLVDVTDRRSREHDLEHDAHHDPLSGLGNRRALHARLHDVTPGQLLAVLFFDLNDFKAVNDHLGHAAGDRLLVEVGRRIGGCVRGADLVVRYGGDEFVVVAEGLDTERAELLAERIVQAVGAPHVEDLETAAVTTSVGVATGTVASAAEAEGLLDLADRVMLRRKTSRRAAQGRASALLHDHPSEPPGGDS